MDLRQVFNWEFGVRLLVIPLGGSMCLAVFLVKIHKIVNYSVVTKVKEKMRTVLKCVKF